MNFNQVNPIFFQVGCLLTALPRACWPLMHVVCSDTHSSTFINLPLERVLALRMHRYNMAKGKSQKRPLHVPQPSLLARHDNTARPSFFFLGHVRQRHLFYFQQRKRSPPSPRLVFLWRWSKAEGENTAEETQKRKFWQDLICCLLGEVCYQRQESFSGAWAKHALDVWRSLIYSWSACPRFFITSPRGVSFLRESQGSWSVGSRKG